MSKLRHSKIVVNALATYTRSVVAMVLLIFSSRWVLQALGKDDFGLFSLTGSIIVAISFVNTMMADSTARFYAYSIGHGEESEVRHWFNVSLCIHTILALVLVAIGWPVGEYLIQHWLHIHPDRLDAARWTFRISLLSAFACMISVPFLAMFTAKQRIFETAFFSLFQSILSFTLAFFLGSVSGDRLIFYALAMSGIVILIQAAIVIRARWIFIECTPCASEWFDFRKMAQAASFGMYKLFGGVGSLARDQGTAVLLNVHAGTSINAAYGIALQVSMATNQLSVAMTSAISPEINTSEGCGDRARMLRLSEKTNKLGTILTSIFAIPLLIEMDNVLRIWLGNPPHMTAAFCRVIIVAFLCERLSVGYILAVSAYGRIAAYQMTLGVVVMMGLPLAWLFLNMGADPATALGVAFISTMTFCSYGRAWWAGKLLKIPLRKWLTESVFPTLLVAIASTAAGMAVHFLMPESFIRLVAVTAATLSTSVCVYWFALSDIMEHNTIKSYLPRLNEKK